jgi:hypothetical protein
MARPPVALSNNMFVLILGLIRWRSDAYALQAKIPIGFGMRRRVSEARYGTVDGGIGRRERWPDLVVKRPGARSTAGPQEPMLYGGLQVDNRGKGFPFFCGGGVGQVAQCFNCVIDRRLRV